ncbi:MAG: tRNA (adenosine(37)-N6)-dimethylallyltransferase MiaA [Gammaproteobacteria bacterium]|nr:tRNA (adenosine(37)-N6)-dimethylallyltransferase MiaA [Gammaproteobacteria bacterium]
MAEHKLIFLMGPTASGKTETAMRLVDEFNGEIISVDSAMVYRDMDIGTAKPEPELLADYPHALIDLLDPLESYSAAQFRIDALREIEAIQQRGHTPILAGGTMLYYRALEYGLSPLPEADPVVRQRLEQEAQDFGSEAMHERLAEVDPESAARIHHNDPQRLHRALEVYELSGVPMSELWRQASEPLAQPPLKIALAPAERVVLHQRIEQRFDQMLKMGFIDEVEKLYTRGDLDVSLPSIRCVGYRQFWSYLADEWDQETAREKSIIATRQLAKRQMTWLRSEQELHWIDPLEEQALDAVMKLVDKYIIKY